MWLSFGRTISIPSQSHKSPGQVYTRGFPRQEIEYTNLLDFNSLLCYLKGGIRYLNLEITLP